MSPSKNHILRIQLKQEAKLTNLLQTLALRKARYQNLFGIFCWINSIKNEILYCKYKIMCSVVVSELRASGSFPKVQYPGYYTKAVQYRFPSLRNATF